MSDQAPQGPGGTPEQPADAQPPQPADSAPATSAPAPAPAPAAASAPASAPAEQPAAASASAAAPTDDPFNGIDQASIDELLRQASFDDPAASAQAAAAATAVAELPETAAINLPNFSQVMRDAQVSSIDLLRDVDLNVKIELGRSRMQVEDVLKLSEGSVVELDKLAGDPVDVFVNDRLVARGEVLVLNDNFCVRINEIMAGIKEEGL